ncbi:hypothetical protein WJX73_000789 [Symbiochloris irregularis]|uniref:Uncharacterized protein n=1 Tax=Symbiochloris irregularis TaxID=706552 RepID=A0AAW1NQ93_9CHLO
MLPPASIQLQISTNEYQRSGVAQKPIEMRRHAGHCWPSHPQLFNVSTAATASARQDRATFRPALTMLPKRSVALRSSLSPLLHGSCSGACRSAFRRPFVP